ncbi:MAG: glycosyltransferase [Phycisphaerales bacterium]|nr:MAG: glycosyltransferase [Phycisphaerales bacterium]
MKVLHVNDYAWAGGCEVLMNETIAALNERGLTAEMFTADEVVNYRRTPLSYIDSCRCRRALNRRLEAFDPDVVHLHNFYHRLSPGILATLKKWRQARRACGLPAQVVMTAHDHHLICPNSGMLSYKGRKIRPVPPAHLDRLWRILITRWDHRSELHSMLKIAQHVWNYRLLKRQRTIDLVICPSRYLQDLMRRFDTLFLPHPTPQVDAGEARHDDELRLVFAGRVEPEKGLGLFLRDLPAEFSGSLEVIGDGSSLPACRAICRRTGLDNRVRFLGALPRAEAIARIAAAHVLLLPSLCPENYPMSLLEALACSTNILVSDLGGAREIVRDSGVGFVFTPANRGSIASALNKVRRRFEDHTLNDFDVSAFLQQRSRDAYVDGLLHAYGLPDGDPA